MRVRSRASDGEAGPRLDPEEGAAVLTVPERAVDPPRPILDHDAADALVADQDVAAGAQDEEGRLVSGGRAPPASQLVGGLRR